MLIIILIIQKIPILSVLIFYMEYAYVVSIRIIVFLHFASGSNILQCSSHFDLCGSGVVELASRALSEGSQQIEFPWVVLQKLQDVGVLSCEGHEGPRSLFFLEHG